MKLEKCGRRPSPPAMTALQPLKALQPIDALRAVTATISFLLIPLLLLPSVVLAQQSTSSTVTIATYNASLYGKKAGEVLARLQSGDDKHAKNVAAIVQSVRPDILLVNEIDYDDEGLTAKTLAEKYFAVGHDGRQGIEYPYRLSVPSNTGIDSEMDLNNNEREGEPNDAWGYGVYPGQYAMAIFSRYPLDVQAVRRFQTFRWNDLPGALRPIDPATNQSYYDDATWQRLRLSSKNHVDVPVQIGGEVIHVLASHPTPPVFDGKEDRNGCRNHDEIRFWVDYISKPAADYLVDDDGGRGGLSHDAHFVIMGDLNSDPNDGDGKRQAIHSLIAHERVNDVMPKSRGAEEATKKNKRARPQRGDPGLDTAKFGGGNMRVDFVLPSSSLKTTKSGVFWPSRDDDTYSWITTSDHRMVWIKVELQ